MSRADTINDLDSQLLAANELRQQRMGGMAKTALDMVDSSGQQQQIGETGSFGEWAGAVRQASNISRQARALKEKAKGKIEDAVAAPIKKGLSSLLKQAWLNIIDSWGLTLIWINIHVFLRWTLGDNLFCKLGEEWLPKQATQAGEEATKTAGAAFGLIEIIVLLIIDLIVLAVIFGVLALIVMIVNFMGASWWEKLKNIWQVFTTLGWDVIKPLLDLF